MEFVRRTVLSFRAAFCYFAAYTSFFKDLKNSLAVSGFGKPELLDVIAGIDKDSHSSSSALNRVFIIMVFSKSVLCFC